jgi:hypothetical protein
VEQVHESGGRPAGAPRVASQPPPREADAGRATEIADAGTAAKITEAGSELASSARDRAADEVGRRSTQAGEWVKGAAADARDIAKDLREKGRTGSADLLDDLTSRMEDAGAYLERVDMDELIADMRDFGRRRPGVLVAGAAVVGVAAGRVLKASEPTGAGAPSRD